METSSATNEVVSWGSHHRSLDSDSLLVVTLSVLHVSPDPQRALVVGTKIVSSDVLLTIGVIVVLGLFAESLVSPGNGGIVDLGAAVAIFVL